MACRCAYAPSSILLLLLPVSFLPAIESLSLTLVLPHWSGQTVRHSVPHFFVAGRWTYDPHLTNHGQHSYHLVFGDPHMAIMYD